jgi:hypothetical protein
MSAFDINDTWGGTVGSAVSSILGKNGGRNDNLFSLNNNNNNDYNNIEMMDYDTAMRQAREMLDPQFQRAKEETLGNLATEQVSKGFYGQAPGDAITQGAVADLTGQYQGQLAGQAQNIRQQDFARNLQQSQNALRQKQFSWQKNYQQQQLDLQEQQLRQARKQGEAEQESGFWGTIGGIAGSFLGGPAGGAIGGWLGGQLGGSSSGGSSSQNTSGYSLEHNKLHL